MECKSIIVLEPRKQYDMVAKIAQVPMGRMSARYSEEVSRLPQTSTGAQKSTQNA